VISGARLDFSTAPRGLRRHQRTSASLEPLIIVPPGDGENIFARFQPHGSPYLIIAIHEHTAYIGSCHFTKANVLNRISRAIEEAATKANVGRLAACRIELTGRTEQNTSLPP